MKIMILTAGFVLTLIGQSAHACTAPSAPSCAVRSGAFEDQADYDRCRKEFETYKEDVETFVHCLRDETELKVKQTVDEYNGIVQSFNRRAGK